MIKLFDLNKSDCTFKSDNINEFDSNNYEKSLNQEIIDLKNTITKLKRKNAKQKQIMKKEKDKFQNIISESLDMVNRISFVHLISMEKELKNAFINNDHDLIDLLIGQKIFDEKSGFTFIIDASKHIAGIYKYEGTSEKVIIPRSILHNSQEFFVTSILPNAFKSDKNVKTICYEENSELMIIYEKAFDESIVEEIFIPPHFIEFKNYWSFNAVNLKKVTVSQLNKNFTYNNDQLLLTKSDLLSDNYDVILFSPRDIEKVAIPQNITIIASCAFFNRKQLKKIKFAPNSQLKTIKFNAFGESSIEEIVLPPNLKKNRSCFIL